MSDTQVSQPPLQLGVARWQSSSQWDVRFFLPDKKRKIFKRGTICCYEREEMDGDCWEGNYNNNFYHMNLGSKTEQ